MEHTCVEKPRIKFLEVADSGRNEALRMVGIFRGLARLLNVQQRPRKLHAHPFQVADSTGGLSQSFGDAEPAVVVNCRARTC